MSGLLVAATLGAVSPRSGAMEKMRIGVIGAGSLGCTVGSVWVKAGHDVMFSSRHPDELQSMARALGSRASVGTTQQAAKFGTILLFAVPYDALEALGRDLQTDIRGKIVVDACNPSAANQPSIAAKLGTKVVGEMKKKLLTGARLVRAFSAVDATSVNASFERASGRLGVPVASDDVAALEVVAALVRDAGCEPVITGDLSTSSRFQRGTPAFRGNTNAEHLKRLLSQSNLT